MNKIEKIAVLGAGSWGATLAVLLAEKGHTVSLWEFDAAAARTLAQTKRLSVLPDLKIPPSVSVTPNLKEALKDRDVIVSVTPSEHVRATMRAAKTSGIVSSSAIVISATKGLEDKTLKRMTEIIAEELNLPSDRISVLSGPSHAEEVCRHMPTATVTASGSALLNTRIQSLFTQDYFRVYTSSDPVGVELGGALKNVFAIACGISDGLGLGDNTKAAIMTRGLHEMAQLGVKQGAQLTTFFGLTGMGDLIVTCLSQHSRNRLLGEKIGRGKSPHEALREMTMVSEGYRTTPAAHALAQKLGQDCPLIGEIYQVLYEGKKPLTSLHTLMARETQEEWRGFEGVQTKGTREGRGE